MRFTKMHGIGNDYVYVNCFDVPFPKDPATLARKMSDRHFGVGGDGLILICPSDNGADARMRPDLRREPAAERELETRHPARSCRIG